MSNSFLCCLLILTSSKSYNRVCMFICLHIYRSHAPFLLHCLLCDVLLSQSCKSSESRFPAAMDYPGVWLELFNFFRKRKCILWTRRGIPYVCVCVFCLEPQKWRPYFKPQVLLLSLDGLKWRLMRLRHPRLLPGLIRQSPCTGVSLWRVPPRL